MYRLQLGRCRLVGCCVVCLLVTVSFWPRCDETLPSSRLAAAPSSVARPSKAVEYSDAGHLTSYEDDSPDYEPLAGVAVEGESWGPAVNSRRGVGGGGGGGGGGHSPSDMVPVGYHEMECLVNDESSIRCRRDDADGEVYVPFTFVGKYFEIYGKMSVDGTKFLWHHSYSRVYPVDQQYSPYGVFMSFEHYNVELRERVKCISGVEGVPVSTQWGPQGYFYPTQIAQYGLSHYSKLLRRGNKGDPESTTIEDAEDGGVSHWTINGDATVQNVFDSDRRSRVIEFQASEPLSREADAILSLSDDAPSQFFLTLDVRLVNNGTITVVVMTTRHRLYRLHYLCSNSMLSVVGDNEILYGIGTNRTTTWSTLGRDIAVDLQKGIALRFVGRKKRPTKIIPRRIHSIELRGSGRIDNVTIATDSHLTKFFYAADWLVRRQDSNGGWPIPVSRSLADGQLTLSPGWYSAMAQGQAMSVLVRAYSRTRRKEYMDAAVRGLSLFGVRSSNGGVAARFMDRYTWYEEYPTSPPCFVLNGFMYALVGLFDVASSTADGPGQQTALKLFADGLLSLQAMLPIFDTGSGTVYDLRHLTLGGGAAPNRARWDYHTTHINQLLLLVSILRNSESETEREMAVEFDAVAQRWTSYMKGQRAPHN